MGERFGVIKLNYGVNRMKKLILFVGMFAYVAFGEVIYEKKASTGPPRSAPC